MKIQTLLAKHKSPTDKIKSHESHDVLILVHTQLTKKSFPRCLAKTYMPLFRAVYIICSQVAQILGSIKFLTTMTMPGSWPAYSSKVAVSSHQNKPAASDCA